MLRQEFGGERVKCLEECQDVPDLSVLHESAGTL